MFVINVSLNSEMSRQSSERQTEASTPFPQDVANQVNVVAVMTIDEDEYVYKENCKHAVSARFCTPSKDDYHDNYDDENSDGNNNVCDILTS